MKIYLRLVDIINSIINYVVGVLMLLMVVSITIQILVRSLFPEFGIIIHAPWTEELPRFILLWFVFLGVTVGARSGDLIAVEALVDTFGASIKYFTKICAMAVTLVFFYLMIWHGVRWMSFGGSETSVAMGINMFWVYMSLPVGFFVASLSILARLLELMSSPTLEIEKASDEKIVNNFGNSITKGIE